MGKKVKVGIELEYLEDIARYYEFPIAVFLLKKGNLPEGTRNDDYLKRLIEAERKIKEIIDDL